MLPDSHHGGACPEWYEIKESGSEFAPRRGLSPSGDVHHQDPPKRLPNATAELASVERCSLENATETPFHADKQRGDET